jgi:PAS domain S-box-containing protein
MKNVTEETLTCSPSGSLNELVKLWQNQPYVNDPDLTDYRKLMQANPALEMVMGTSPCLSWILDIRTQTFVLVSNNLENLLGYKASTFRKNGLAFLNDLMHPDEKKVIWRRTTELWHSLQTLPVSQRQGYRFNRKYRLRRANGSYVCFLEQNSVLQTDFYGNVTHLFSVLSDVTDLLKTESAGSSVPVAAKLNGNSASSFQAPAPKLSKREKQIVRLVAEGYSSKIIADQLFISHHTVNTHRRNIIEKTHSRNTSGLVQFAFNNRII